jgi:FkbM family methyltransferase
MTLPPAAIRQRRVAGFTIQYVNEEEVSSLEDDIFRHEVYRFDSLRKAPRIVDCGAHIGLSVLYFKHRFPRSRITAFEPNPETFQLLTRNVHGNGFTDVELVNAAIGDRRGTLDFYTSRDPFFWRWGDAAVKNLWFSDETHQTIRVPSVPLYDYVAEPVDYLKLDIEGLETRVLHASSAALRFIRALTVEFHGSRSNMDNQLATVRTLLEDGGFSTVLRQGHWLTRECDIDRAEPYTVLIHAYRSRLALAWFLRHDVEQRLRLRCGLSSRASRLQHARPEATADRQHVERPPNFPP